MKELAWSVGEASPEAMIQNRKAGFSSAAPQGIFKFEWHDWIVKKEG